MGSSVGSCSPVPRRSGRVPPQPDPARPGRAGSGCGGRGAARGIHHRGTPRYPHPERARRSPHSTNRLADAREAVSLQPNLLGLRPPAGLSPSRQGTAQGGSPRYPHRRPATGVHAETQHAHHPRKPCGVRRGFDRAGHAREADAGQEHSPTWAGTNGCGDCTTGRDAMAASSSRSTSSTRVASAATPVVISGTISRLKSGAGTLRRLRPGVKAMRSIREAGLAELAAGLAASSWGGEEDAPDGPRAPRACSPRSQGPR